MSTIFNEDLYARGRRLYQEAHSHVGGGPEYEAALTRFTEFNLAHPQIGNEVSYGSPARVFGALTFDSDPPFQWDEAAELQRFTGVSYWDSFLKICPLGLGFRAEITALITFLKGRAARLVKHESQLGKSF